MADIVLVTSPGLRPHLQLLQSAAPDAEFRFADDREAARDAAADISILCGAPTRELLDAAPGLRWVQVTSAGVNRFPLEQMQERGILLTNVRGMHGDTIADHVMALILAHSRDLPRRLQLQRQHCWDREGRSWELAGSTLGIVGVGGIGIAVARRARAFGMCVLGTRHSGTPLHEVDHMYRSQDLHDMLPKSQYLVVCCPLTPETEGLLGAEELASLPADAFVVNIARGPIIDEDALVAELARGHLGGAGLDVFREEPLAADSPLWDMEGVIVTPHVAGQQRDYAGRAARRFAANLQRWVGGQALQGLVDYDKGY